MDNGWIKLHRKILENPIMGHANYLSLWVVLLLKTNHKDNKMLWNNQIVLVKEGQLITGRKVLAKQIGVSESSIERMLSLLESEHQIKQQKNTKYRLITIVNWKEYQSSEQQKNNKRTTDEQQMNTNKNDNNDKKDILDEQGSSEIPEIIKAFESINSATKKMYGNKTQRNACKELINLYGFERVLKVINETLHITNKIAYFPIIITPLQLWNKWATLESQVYKHKDILSNNKNKEIA